MTTTNKPAPILRRRVRVVSTREIDIYLMPSLLGDQTVEEFLFEFGRTMWPVVDLDCIARFAADVANDAQGDSLIEDGIGLLSPIGCERPRPGDVQYHIVDEDIETEIIQFDGDGNSLIDDIGRAAL